MAENRRDSNFFLRSDINVRNVTANESGLSHLKCLRTPSVVVSDHSEETGCFAYEDINRIRMAHGRKRKTKTGRRHSVDANEGYGHRKRSDLMDGNSIESYKSLLNVSPVLRGKHERFGVERKSVSLDDDLGKFVSNIEFGKKVLEESDSSNELSVIPSECGSTNFDGSSGRNSIFSETSPLFIRKNMNFNEVQRKLSDFEPNAKIERNDFDLGCCVEPQASDDADFYFLERQRSLSYDDLYMDSSAASDVSYTDLSTDFSACSSLSNLAGTLYHKTYDSGQDYSSAKCHKLKNGNIKTSKSCSDFLSVSRIVEDYPHVKCRRHSNGQVAIDVSQCHPKKIDSEDESRKKWMTRGGLKKCSKTYKTISADDRSGCRMRLALGRLAALKLKSFHESLTFKKENHPSPNRKSMSSESFFDKSSRSIDRSRSSEKEPSSPTKLKELEKNSSNVKILDLGDCNKRKDVKKNWLSVEWKNNDMDAVKDEVSRKVSDCSTCSTNSGEQNGVTEIFGEINGKAKTSSWRKLRNIVQWTPFFQTYKKQRYPWVQLAGHQGNFKAGPEQGTILKKLCPKEEKCYKILMKDALRPYVPEYKGQVKCDESDCIYLQLEDLLVDFDSPCVLDCKLGVRTYLEEELQKAKEKPKLRKDMYEKMIQIDPTAPTLEEHRLKAVTKPRYMIWRETISSTSTLGFRLEGVRKGDGKSSKDFKTMKAKEEVKEAFREFVNGFPHAVPKYIQRLKAIKATLEVSIFFSSHEIIGSSLLFVHDKVKANIWLIDFAKTLMLPEQTFIDHKSQWEMGNHEDGYLIGMENLIEIFSELEKEQKFSKTETETAMSKPSAAINSS